VTARVEFAMHGQRVVRTQRAAACGKKAHKDGLTSLNGHNNLVKSMVAERALARKSASVDMCNAAFANQKGGFVLPWQFGQRDADREV